VELSVNATVSKSKAYAAAAAVRSLFRDVMRDGIRVQCECVFGGCVLGERVLDAETADTTAFQKKRGEQGCALGRVNGAIHAVYIQQK
jgi:hypothetical protein